MVAAAIGAGGAIVGGFIGGLLALAATRRRSRREAAARRTERSEQAALALVESVAALEQAVITWASGDCDAVALRTAFNVYSQAAVALGFALTDKALGDRVRNHTEFAGTLARRADNREFTTPTVEPVRRHADAVIDALLAHVVGAPLPPYQAPPLEPRRLLAWGWTAPTDTAEDRG